MGPIRTNRFIVFLFFLVPLLLFLPSFSSADPSGAAFLTIEPSVRAFSLGGSHPVLTTGCESLHANPANLPDLTTDFEVMTAYSRVIDETHMGYLSAATELWLTHYAAVQILYTLTHGLQARDTLGEPLGTFSAYDYAIGAAWATPLLKNLRTGASLMILQSGIESDHSGLACAIDLGAAYDSPFAQFGASLTHLGTGVTFANQTDPLPLMFDLGAAKRLGPVAVVLSAFYNITDSALTVTAGAEYGLWDLLDLRMGYRIKSEDNPALRQNDVFTQFMDGLSVGIGFRYKTIRLDYGLASAAAEWGMTHRFSLTVGWNTVSPHPTRRKP